MLKSSRFFPNRILSTIHSLPIYACKYQVRENGADRKGSVAFCLSCIERVALKSGQCRVINRSYLFTCRASTSRPRALAPSRPRPAPAARPGRHRHRGPSRGRRLSLAVHPVFRFVLNSTLTLYAHMSTINCMLITYFASLGARRLSIYIHNLNWFIYW